jgi:hypothetical protein
VVAYFVDNISVVFSLNGSLFGFSIVAVLPGLFYIRLFPPIDEAEELEQLDQADEKKKALLSLGSPTADCVLAPDGTIAVPAHDDDDDKADALPEYNGCLGGVDQWLKERGEEHSPCVYRIAWCMVIGGLLVSIVTFSITLANVIHGKHHHDNATHAPANHSGL